MKTAILIALMLATGARAQMFAQRFGATTAAWTPAQLPNLALWLDGSDLDTLTLVGTNVTAWADKSGAGNHAVQAGANATRPVGCTVTLNGLCTVSFNGGQNLQTPLVPTNQMTIVAVANSTTVGRFVIGSRDGSTATRSFLSATSTGGFVSGGVGAHLFTTILSAVPFTPAKIAELSYNGSTVTLYNSGTNVYSGAQSGTGANNIGYAAGSQWNGSGYSGNMVGEIAEIVVVKGRVITADERAQLTAYLKAKWGDR